MKVVGPDCERHVRQALRAGVLHDDVDADAGLCERLEQPRCDAGPICRAAHGDLGDVPFHGYARDGLPDLHPGTSSVDERPGSVPGRHRHENWHSVYRSEFYGTGVHLSAQGGHLEHFVVADLGQLARFGHQARVRGVDTLHVRVDLAHRRTEGRGKGDRCRIRASSPQRRHVVRLGQTLEARNDDDAAVVEFPLEAPGVYRRDPGCAVHSVSADARLLATEAHDGLAERPDGHCHQRRAHQFARREQRVHLPEVRGAGAGHDTAGQRDQVVGGVPHRGNHHYDPGPFPLPLADAPGNGTDSLGVREGTAAVLLHDGRTSGLPLACHVSG